MCFALMTMSAIKIQLSTGMRETFGSTCHGAGRALSECPSAFVLLSLT